ncbi:MAG: prepilin-type N-terminal cleavage/methylation domain-containing protein [Verrucomicrobia bacterium]|nr:prepilin-type N-terminal cleavage/methylation domain-containing protein [Verrucomicrobiota bacterium]
MIPVLPNLKSRGCAARSRRGFSLLEMLIGMAMLSVIVLALFAMFNQTQKALIANSGQTDVMENGRAVMDLLIRDLGRARPSNIGTNLVFVPRSTNVQERLGPAPNLMVLRTAAGPSDPQVRAAFLDGWRRTTLFHDLFYMAENRPGQWTGAGLFVAPENPITPDDAVGTLYRYEDPWPVSLRGARGADQANLLYGRFFNNAAYRQSPTNSSRLLDGVVFFRATPFGPSGQALDPTTWTQTNAFPVPKDVLIGPNPAAAFPLNGTLFRGRAFPTSIELEIGILPPELMERYRVLPVNPPGIRTRFLTNNLANILVFRQRVPMPVSSATQ